MKRLALALLSTAVISAGAQAADPAGWKTIKDTAPKGKCHMAVPPEFKQGDILGQKIAAAESPDKSVDAVVNTMDDVDWAMFKTIVYQIYTKEKDRPKIEDGAKRLWFEIVSMAAPGKTSWYVAVPAGGSTCNAQINFRKGDKKAEELARKIADTIGG